MRATRRLVSRPGRQALTAKAAAPTPTERSSPDPAQQPASAPAQMSSPFKARSGPQGGPAAAEDLPADSTVTISTCIVGRRFRATEAVSRGMKVTLRHDKLNPQDASAVMVLVEDTEALLGYVPRQVASVLCPLLTEGLAIIEGRVEALGRTSSAPVPVTLQVCVLGCCCLCVMLPDCQQRRQFTVFLLHSSRPQRRQQACGMCSVAHLSLHARPALTAGGQCSMPGSTRPLPPQQPVSAGTACSQASPSWAPALQGERRAKIWRRLQEAAQAARVAQEASMQRSGSGTGDILRTNFLVLVQTVRQQDSHLLVAEELELLQRFEVSPAASACAGFVNKLETQRQKTPERHPS